MNTIWHALQTQAERQPDRILLRFADQQWRYADAVEQSRRAAAVFADLGVRPGDRVALMLGNTPDYLWAWFGCACLGAVTVPINIHLKGDVLHYILEHAGATVLVVEQHLLDRIVALRDRLPALRHLLVRGDGVSAPNTLAWHEALRNARLADPVPVNPTDLHSILYTSGTTGPPKGVMLNHHAYLHSAQLFADVMIGATEDDVFGTSLPLFHINAQAHTVLPAIYRGTTIALIEQFSASRYWRQLADLGATICNLLAAMIPILMKQPPSPDDRAHRARIAACAATPPDLWRAFEERFGLTIIEGYGLTETTGFCVANPRDATRVGTFGKPLPGFALAIFAPDDTPLPPGVAGEIAIRPLADNLIMMGYYRQPDQTATAMRGGWFHTGDLGRLDEAGYAIFIDRLKQSIRRRGENISSWEVERAVNAHPAVLESAAVGVPSELGEEEVKVVVVLRPGATLDPLELIKWCEERLAYFAVPRYVEFRASLPKTATERVEKYKLKAEGVGNAWDREAAGYRIRRPS
ncbi:ATP-dependent acyl-CoA ligase [Chloroflexus sp.]|uniref:ATP-dependent acyl-CoA ligase n=1 Tax=Chloroflexus sp. TaxID=1904827 RepID=UPI0026356452|nr:ATP-dependent acyl-CoA ligase [uncultured Chloroflexus sp.]